MADSLHSRTVLHEWDTSNLQATARALIEKAVRDHRLAELRELCFVLLESLQPAGEDTASIDALTRQVRDLQDARDEMERRDRHKLLRALRADAAAGIPRVEPKPVRALPTPPPAPTGKWGQRRRVKN